MAADIPLIPSEPWYTLTVPLDNPEGDGTTAYVFVVRWNERDEHWYFDLLEQDNTAILTGVRIVLGTYLGRRSRHPLLRGGVFIAIDTTGEGRDAAFDDLGTRVVLRYFTVQDVMAGRGAAAA